MTNTNENVMAKKYFTTMTDTNKEQKETFLIKLNKIFVNGIMSYKDRHEIQQLHEEEIKETIENNQIANKIIYETYKNKFEEKDREIAELQADKIRVKENFDYNLKCLKDLEKKNKELQTEVEKLKENKIILDLTPNELSDILTSIQEQEMNAEEGFENIMLFQSKNKRK